MIPSITRFDSHHRLFWSLLAAACGYLVLRSTLSLPTLFIATWNLFALIDLGLSWAVMFSAHPQDVRRSVKLQDSGRTVIFILVVAAACVSLLTIGFLLGPTKTLPPAEKTGHIILSILAVIFSWLLMHSVFSLRYAHFYYGEEGTNGLHHAGLVFPNENRPDFLDFAYFGFVIGMTFQVSDVQITSRKIRRLALVHGILSFGFNTAILALSVNVILNVFS